MFTSILFVCTGNICRSPMAEGLFKSKLAAVNSGIKVSSAGTHALVGKQAEPAACKLLLERYAVDIAAHRARQITTQILLDADLILVMEHIHLQIIEKIALNSKGRVFLLGKFGGYEIIDPYKRSEDVFEKSLQLIDHSWYEWQKFLCD